MTASPRSALAEPLVLPCGAMLQNRLAKAAMTEGLADARNRATTRHERLYRRWAQPVENVSAGLLLTGNVQVDRRFLERPGNVAIDGPQSNAALDALAAWARGATGRGGEIWMQLSHAGRQTPAMVTKTPLAPSAVKLDLPGGMYGEPRAMTHDEVEDVIARFAHAAEVAKQTGFTGVQVHAAHGYLISEFLSPIANRREDDWGGSLENRARLLLRVVAEVRAVVGPEFPVAVKLNSSDFQKGGFTFDECLEVVEWLNAAGIDLLEISGGSYEQPKMMDIEGIEAAHEETKRASTRRREAYFLEYARAVKGVAKTPLMVTGGFRTRAGMEEALDEGVDVIGVGRPLCLEPSALARMLAGETDGLPAWERRVRLGPGVFGPHSPVTTLRALNGLATMAFFYQNLFRLADGLDGDPNMGLLGAFLRHQRMESAAAKALER